MVDLRSFFAELGRKRVLGHAVPHSMGGLGDGFQQLAAAHEALGRETGDTGLLLALNAHVWGAIFPILFHATEPQREMWGRPLVSGEWIGGHAISEPQAGSDLQAIETRAEMMDEGYCLNGHKRWISNTPDADLMVVYARHNGATSAFVIKRSDIGAHFKQGPTVHACISASMGDLILDNCLIGTDRLLGKGGNGSLMIQQVMELERAFIFAGISGIMEKQLEIVIRAMRRRRANGRPLASQQVIAHRIVDMRTRLDTLKLWLRQCTEIADSGKRLTLASSQTKLVGSEAFLASSIDATHMLGASGLEAGGSSSYWVSDAMASRLFSGSSEIQKNIISTLIGVGQAR
jgi:alkylation response protein AidB-like acyl-CoA dehydrogenase